MAKNPHAVELGRLGGAKGGTARARRLSARRRSEIASIAGIARSHSLSSEQRREIARKASVARWAARNRRAPVTAQDAPIAVRRLLKTYDPRKLRWVVSRDRYAVVREILVRGDEEANAWLAHVLPKDRV